MVQAAAGQAGQERQAATFPATYTATHGFVPSDLLRFPPLHSLTVLTRLLVIWEVAAALVDLVRTFPWPRIQETRTSAVRDSARCRWQEGRTKRVSRMLA